MDLPARTQARMVAGTLVVLVLLTGEWLVISGTVEEGSQIPALNLAVVTTALGVGLNAVLLSRLRGDVRAATRRLRTRIQDRAPTAGPRQRERYVVVPVSGGRLYHHPRCPLVVGKDIRRVGDHDGPRRACGLCVDE